MKRYRGKAKHTQKWYYGSYVKAGNKHFIVNPDAGFAHCDVCSAASFAGFVEVIPETVGQETGLKDENGKEAYKSDLFRSEIRGCEPIEIIWEDGGWKGIYKGKSGQWHSFVLNQKEMSLAEIIGNKWDKPELLEAK